MTNGPKISLPTHPITPTRAPSLAIWVMKMFADPQLHKVISHNLLDLVELRTDVARQDEVHAHVGHAEHIQWFLVGLHFRQPGVIARKRRKQSWAITNPPMLISIRSGMQRSDRRSVTCQARVNRFCNDPAKFPFFFGCNLAFGAEPLLELFKELLCVVDVGSFP